MRNDRLRVLGSIVLASLMSSSSYAEWREIDRVQLKRTPHYFFRMFSGGESALINSHYSNYLITFKRNRSGRIADYDEVKLPGILDPVPTPDNGRFTTIPFFGGNYLPVGGGMQFYLTQDLIQGREHRLLKDSHLSGAYQTIGILSDDPATKTTKYRVVSESVFNKKTGFFVQEYTTRELPDGKIKFDRTWHEEKRVCPEIPFSLPMLSKTGRLMGGRDPSTSDTIIMSIDENQNCRVIRELERPTGKLDFSYDDQYVAFHAESEMDMLGLRDEKSIDSGVDVTRVTRIRRSPSKHLTLNVFTYNLRTGEFDKVTHCRGSNCYYPGFTQNGDLVYFEQRKESKKYFLVFLRNDGMPNSSNLDISPKKTIK